VILFFVSWVGFVHIVYHLHGICWAATLGAGLALDRLPKWPRVAASVLLAPMAIALVRGQLLHRDPGGGVVIARPGHGWVVADAAMAADVNTLLAAVKPDLGGDRAMVSGPELAGFEGFYDLPHVGHADLYTPAMVRPADEDDLVAGASRIGAMAIETFGPPASPPRDVCDAMNHVYRAPVLHEKACAALAAELGPPAEVAPNFWVAHRRH
jgi:hypothetical protein